MYGNNLYRATSLEMVKRYYSSRCSTRSQVHDVIHVIVVAAVESMLLMGFPQFAGHRKLTNLTPNNGEQLLFDCVVQLE